MLGSQLVSNPVCEQQLFDFSSGKTICQITKETERQPHQRIHSLIGDASVDQIQNALRMWEQQANYKIIIQHVAEMEIRQIYLAVFSSDQ